MDLFFDIVIIVIVDTIITYPQYIRYIFKIVNNKLIIKIIHPFLKIKYDKIQY